MSRKVLAAENIEESRLSGPAAHQQDRTVRQMIVHGLHDESSHKGEMWLLRKLIAKQRAADKRG